MIHRSVVNALPVHSQSEAPDGANGINLLILNAEEPLCAEINTRETNRRHPYSLWDKRINGIEIETNLNFNSEHGSLLRVAESTLDLLHSAPFIRKPSSPSLLLRYRPTSILFYSKQPLWSAAIRYIYAIDS